MKLAAWLPLNLLSAVTRFGAISQNVKALIHSSVWVLTLYDGSSVRWVLFSVSNWWINWFIDESYLSTYSTVWDHTQRKVEGKRIKHRKARDANLQLEHIQPQHGNQWKEHWISEMLLMGILLVVLKTHPTPIVGTFSGIGREFSSSVNRGAYWGHLVQQDKYKLLFEFVKAKLKPGIYTASVIPLCPQDKTISSSLYNTWKRVEGVNIKRNKLQTLW